VRVRNRFATGVTIVLGTLVASALAIVVTLVTSDLDRWPGWLRPLRPWAWWTILVLIAAACVLTVWERGRQEGRASPQVPRQDRPAPAAAGSAWVGDVHIVVVNSTVGDVTITVRDQPAAHPPRIHGITSEPIGRTSEIALLLEWLRYRRDRGPVVVITGPPGVGKSTLAQFVANTLAVDDYPDAQLAVQLSEPAGQRPPGADELLRTMVAALDPEGRTAGDQGLQRRYLRAFGSDRVLLLLEGAQTAEQVLPLRPPNACAAIITSQHALPELERDAMVHVLRLDTLSLWRSVAFLDHRIGRRRVARAPLATLRLAKACNGFPSALAAVSSGFTAPSGRFRSVRQAMDLLRQRIGDGLPEIEAVFALGLESCERRQRKMFQVLGLAGPRTVETAAAAAAAGVPFDDAAHQLRALADASLLQAVGPDRWRVQELVRSYAGKLAGRLGPFERDEIHRRLAGYDQARALVRDSPREPREARAWLQRTRPRTDVLLRAVAEDVLDLSQAALDGLASLLIEVISADPRSRHASGTASRVRAFAVKQHRQDLVDRVDDWTRRERPILPMPRPSPPPVVEDPPPRNARDAWSFQVGGFQPGEPATLTVDGQHTEHAAADAGGAFTCTLLLPQPPCHAVAVGDWGSRAEGLFC
jgi:hypothetical protein